MTRRLSAIVIAALMLAPSIADEDFCNTPTGVRLTKDEGKVCPCAHASASCIITDDRFEFAAINGKRCATNLDSSTTSSTGSIDVEFTWQICNYDEGDYVMNLNEGSHFKLWHGEVSQYNNAFANQSLMPGPENCITQISRDTIRVGYGGKIKMEAQLEGDASTNGESCRSRKREIIDLDSKCQLRAETSCHILDSNNEPTTECQDYINSRKDGACEDLSARFTWRACNDERRPVKLNRKSSNVMLGGKLIGQVQGELEAGTCQDFFAVRPLSTCQSDPVRWSLNMKGREWQSGSDAYVDQSCHDYDRSDLTFVEPPIQLISRSLTSKCDVRAETSCKIVDKGIVTDTDCQEYIDSSDECQVFDVQLAWKACNKESRAVNIHMPSSIAKFRKEEIGNLNPSLLADECQELFAKKTVDTCADNSKVFWSLNIQGKHWQKKEYPNNPLIDKECQDYSFSSLTTREPDVETPTIAPSNPPVESKCKMRAEASCHIIGQNGVVTNTQCQEYFDARKGSACQDISANFRWKACNDEDRTVKINRKSSNAKFGKQRIGQMKSSLKAKECQDFSEIRQINTCDSNIFWSVYIKGRDWQKVSKGGDPYIDRDCKAVTFSKLNVAIDSQSPSLSPSTSSFLPSTTRTVSPTATISQTSAPSLQPRPDCTSDEALLEVLINLDHYVGETNWVLEDSNGVVLDRSSEGDFSGLSFQSITIEKCLPSSCDGSSYTFRVLDYYGDGLRNRTTDTPADESVKIFFGGREVHVLSEFSYEIGVTFDACSDGCAENESLFEMFLKLDEYQNDTSWMLEDSNGTVIANAARGDYESYYDGAIIQKCLPSRCDGTSYTFTVLDDYGDGLENGTPGNTTDDGSIEIMFGGEKVQMIDGFLYGTSVTFDACEQTCQNGDLLFELNLDLDYFANDTSWLLEVPNGAVIANVTVGDYEAYYHEVIYKTCLPSPCDGTSYKFTVSDAWGDGLNNDSPLNSTDDGAAVISFGGEVVEVVDSFYYGSSVTFGACQQTCTAGESLFELNLNLDYYPEQTKWTLADSNGTVVDSAEYGDYKNYYEEAVYKTCLPSPCGGVAAYTFTMFDDAGNGLTNETPELSDDGVIRVAIDGQIECEEKNFVSTQYVCTFEVDNSAC